MAFQPPHARQDDRESLVLMRNPPDRASLLAELARVREVGAIIHESRDIVGVTDVTCPIVMPDGHAVAGITAAAVPRRSAPATLEAMLTHQQPACAEIASQLSAYSPQAQLAGSY